MKFMKSAAVNEVAPIPFQVTPHLKGWILNHKWILPGMTWQCYWPILWGLTIVFHWMYFCHMVPGEVYRVYSILWWHLRVKSSKDCSESLCVLLTKNPPLLSLLSARQSAAAPGRRTFHVLHLRLISHGKFSIVCQGHWENTEHFLSPPTTDKHLQSCALALKERVGLENGFGRNAQYMCSEGQGHFHDPWMIHGLQNHLGDHPVFKIKH